VITFLDCAWNDYFLGGIWLSALGLTALADRAERTRMTGGDPSEDLALGETLLQRTIETARRGRPRGGRLGPEGRAWMARARAEYQRLIGADAPELWTDAIDEFDYGYRYEIARTRWRRAASHAARGDHLAARADAIAALAEAKELGARPLAAAIADLGQRARLNLPGARQQGMSPLTEREEEVLALVAQGLTNRQIGERLFISGKTVSVHISNVLGKLGVSGRAEAVAVAHQRGLLQVERAG
jgi:DNA-binding CsgD family transcriptional regulator